jgi:hypothetical protein
MTYPEFFKIANKITDIDSVKIIDNPYTLGADVIVNGVGGVFHGDNISCQLFVNLLKKYFNEVKNGGTSPPNEA